MKKWMALTLVALLLLATGCDILPVSRFRSLSRAEKASALPAPTPTLSPSPSPTPWDSPFTPDELRELAFGAVLTTRNAMQYDTLAGLDEMDRLSAYMTLNQSYGIYDRETALDTLGWLAYEGHRGVLEAGFDDILPALRGDGGSVLNEVAYRAVSDTLREDYGYTEEELDIPTLAAWDMDRLVTVARWCYLCDLIAEEEAWLYIGYAAEVGSESYGSWREYFAGVLLGRALWSGVAALSEQDRRIADALLLGEDSVYRQVAFEHSQGERRASHPYQPWDDLAVEQEENARLQGHTFGIAIQDALSLFASGFPEEYAVSSPPGDDFGLEASAPGHMILFSLSAASNDEVDYAALYIYDEGAEGSLETCVPILAREFRRLAEILRVSPQVIEDAFASGDMQITDTEVNGDVVTHAEAVVRVDNVTYTAQYSEVNGVFLSASAFVTIR